VLQRNYDVAAVIPIALVPSGEMMHMRHPVPLLSITSVVGQHEIVAQINRVFGPRDEMIDMAAIASNRLRAVEAPPLLQVY
jgi:hypothetical protein